MKFILLLALLSFGFIGMSGSLAHPIPGDVAEGPHATGINGLHNLHLPFRNYPSESDDDVAARDEVAHATGINGLHNLHLPFRNYPSEADDEELADSEPYLAHGKPTPAYVPFVKYPADA
ncbi:hypothetical protein DFH06DRAFT_439227 [Mycena polygramma]|nr:hypothetical protein DFH06DRAFT_439227 [Mycena polygramma]